MNIEDLLKDENEKPLDVLKTDGGFCGIFRTIGCVGDSLASGEMESLNEKGEKGYHDYYEYSWGQYIARNIGAKVYNFSKGGMTAREYCESFAEANNFWSPVKACQAYIIALGVNDITKYGTELGNISDIDLSDCKNNKKTFTGYYAQIIQRLKEIQPKARFFIMTMPLGDKDEKRIEAGNRHQEILYELTDLFEYTYVLDFRKYAPVYDEEYKKRFCLGGHLNAAGYILTARMVETYIDYIIRHNMEDFAQTAFIGTPFHNCGAKW